MTRRSPRPPQHDRNCLDRLELMAERNGALPGEQTREWALMYVHDTPILCQCVILRKGYGVLIRRANPPKPDPTPNNWILGTSRTIPASEQD